jgi:predicted transcriptional regulator
MARPVVKLSVNLSQEVVDVIRELAERRDTTMTEVLRRSIGTQKYLQDAVDKGGKILIEDRRGRLRQIVF